jgi:benzodiazapine receptor
MPPRLISIPRPHSVLAAAGFAGATAAAAAAGALASRGAARSPWYRALRKPPYQPPHAAFAPVWSVLYVLIAASGYRVWRSWRLARDPALALWGTQLALNAAWSPVFFRARRPRAALAVSGALVGAVGAYAWKARKADRPAAVMVLPYLAWAGFALALNAGIVRRNG